MKKINIEDFADFILWDKLGDFSFGEKFTSARIKFESKKEDWEVLRTMISLDTTTVYACQGGDNIPVPDGVKIEFILYSFEIEETGYIYLNKFYHVGNTSDYIMDLGGKSAITGFRILGLEEGYELDMSDE